MKIENQVISLELSKQLKKVGYPQEGLWWWAKPDLRGFENREKDEVWQIVDKDCLLWHGAKIYVAPTVAELGEAMKDRDEYKYFLWGYHLLKRDCFDIVLETSDKQERLHEVRAITEANARAKMWLHLKKEGLIK